MPNNLTDDPTQFPSPVQIPAPNDPRTDTSVATPFQQVANRTANTKARVDAVVPFSAAGYAPALPGGVLSGVSSVLQCTTLTQLASIPVANRTAGMICLVLNTGIYQYTTSSIAALANFVVTPADTVGSWVLVGAGYGLANQPNAFAQADSTGRTPAAGVRNGLFGYQACTPGTLVTNPLAAFPSGTLTFTGLQIGDIIEARYSTDIQSSAVTGDDGHVSVQVLPPGSSLTPMVGSDARSPPVVASTSIFAHVGSVATFTVTAAGTHTVGLYGQNAGSSATCTFSSASFVAQVIRP